MKSREHAGQAPDPEDIAQLIRERYPLKKTDRLSVTKETSPRPSLLLRLDSGKDRYQIGVEYLRGANGREVWMLAADALDSLFGMFVEAERSYRELPAGEEVEFDGAVFNVIVEHAVPELAREADRLLQDDGATPRRS